MGSDKVAENIYAAVVPKICTIIILPLTSCIAGMLPIKMGKRFYRPDIDPEKPTIFDKTMSFFLFFGGGVLLCTIFLHLLPEIHEDVELLARKGINLDRFVLSFPELVTCIGFFLIFLAEEVMHTYLIKPASSRSQPSTVKVNRGIDKTVFVVESNSNFAKIKDDEGIASDSEQERIKNVFDGNKNYHSCTEHQCSTVELADQSRHQRHTHDRGHSDLPDPSVSVFYGLLTVVALSTHGLFEGLAVGLAPKASDVWYLLTAIACHKIVLSGFIGVQLLVTGVNAIISYIYVFAFAIASPLGIIVGLFMSTNAPMSDTLSIISITLQAMAAGTLLYVTFFEVYSKQFGNYQLPGILKLLSSVAGFVLMAFLQMEMDS